MASAGVEMDARDELESRVVNARLPECLATVLAILEERRGAAELMGRRLLLGSDQECGEAGNLTVDQGAGELEMAA